VWRTSEFAISESQNPKLILLDEPLAGISSSLAKKIVEHILEQKYLAIIIEHDMTTLKSLCKKIIKIENGSFHTKYLVSKSLEKSDKH